MSITHRIPTEATAKLAPRCEACDERPATTIMSGGKYCRERVPGCAECAREHYTQLAADRAYYAKHIAPTVINNVGKGLKPQRYGKAW